MIILVMAISNLVLTQQIYSEETNGAHAQNRARVPLIFKFWSRCLFAALFKHLCQNCAGYGDEF